MTASRRLRTIAATAALASGLALLASCGGGAETPVATAAQTSAFASGYGGGLAALNTRAGVSSAAFLDQIDDNFLDAGYTKNQLRDNLSAEATALAVSADLSLYPMARLSNVQVVNCNDAAVCTLTATLTNSDADTTTVDFTTLVRIVDGKVRLYGDQKTS